ncbi:MAG: N-acetyl-gamma-glutamyl-phosphate reductase [Acidobacteriota bacterium]
MPGDDELRVAVAGASGYVGGELLRLLAAHSAVGGLRALSESAAGKPWSAVHASLRHAREGSFEGADVLEAARWADVLFLAWPHGRSQRRIEDIESASPRLVIDAAADFRVRDRGLGEAHYGDHAAPGRLPEWTYGLADVAGARLLGKRRIAAPGCFATATLLALYPFVRPGALASPPVSFAVTGSSGAGAEPRRTTHHPVRGHNMFAYSLGGHRHEAEIDEQVRDWSGDGKTACRLVAHPGPFVRGIHATVHLRLAIADPEAPARLAETYAGSRFVEVLDHPVELTAVVGTNFAHLHAAVRDGGREVLVTSVIDNLVKGAAGQAVQCMNLALGLPEASGLEFGGIYPC